MHDWLEMSFNRAFPLKRLTDANFVRGKRSKLAKSVRRPLKSQFYTVLLDSESSRGRKLNDVEINNDRNAKHMLDEAVSSHCKDHPEKPCCREIGKSEVGAS